MRPNGSPVVVVTDAGGQETKNWKQTCAVFARQNYQGPPLTTALAVTFKFVRTRPKAHLRSNGTVKESCELLMPTTKPDVTKLVRAAEDALTGIVWADDALIVHQVAGKRYGDTPGLDITIETMAESVQPALKI